MKNKEHKPSQSTDPEYVILAIDKQDLLIRAVSGIARNGFINTLVPILENIDKFMKIDSQEGPLTAFFQNYISTLQVPDRFHFFRVRSSEACSAAKSMQQTLDIYGRIPQTVQRSLGIQEIKAVALAEIATQNQKHSKARPYKFDPQRIDWPLMEKMGMSRQSLTEMGILNTLLKGQKTDGLVAIKLNLGIIETRLDARLSLKQKPDGDVVVVIHGIRQQPALDRPFLGHDFSTEDKNNLLSTGHMGRTVDLRNPYTGESIRSVISIDRLTKELIAMRSSQINIPGKIHGIHLDENQRQILIQGKPLHLSNLEDRSGRTFDARLQLNAATRKVEIKISPASKQQKTVNITDPPSPQQAQTLTVHAAKQPLQKRIKKI